MKLNKETSKSLILVAILVGGGLYYFFSEMLGPLRKRPH